MPWNSPKRPPYWNFTPGSIFDLIAAVDMSFCTSLRNFIQIWPPSAEKITSCPFSRWRISAILDFRGPIMGSLKSPCTTSFVSRDHSPKLRSFWENRVFLHLATDEQMDSTDALSRSRCRERQLNKDYTLHYNIKSYCRCMERRAVSLCLMFSSCGILVSSLCLISNFMFVVFYYKCSDLVPTCEKGHFSWYSRLAGL